ncbi:MAG TPA: hypothetical protein VE983_12680 [Solirubrobacteraceae bacterium]|nr:hypothetical protein [Solirubrobacteraceae bacterium]
MNKDVEARPARHPTVWKAAGVAGAVIVAALVVKAIIGFVISIFWGIVAVAVVVAVIWVLRRLA